MEINNESFINTKEIPKSIDELELNSSKIANELIKNWVSEKDTLKTMNSISQKLTNFKDIADKYISTWFMDWWDIDEWSYQEKVFFDNVETKLNSYIENKVSNLSENQEKNTEILTGFFNDLDLDDISKQSVIMALAKNEPIKQESKIEEKDNISFMDKFANWLANTLSPWVMNRKNQTTRAMESYNK